MDSEVDFKGTSSKVEEKGKKSKEPWLQCRHTVALMGFFLNAFVTASRINMSVTIVAMVNNSATVGKAGTESTSCHDVLLQLREDLNSSQTEFYEATGEFDWSPALVGNVLGSYFFMYLFGLIPAGKLVERYGCRGFLIWGTVLSSLATLAIPVGSRFHAYTLIVIQFLRGIVHSAYLPGMNVLAANWFPKMDRGHFNSFMLSGRAVGSFLGAILSGLLCKSKVLGTWKSSFYAFGTAGLALSLALHYFIHELPSEHPSISPTELKYITSNQETVLTRRRPNAPWKRILTSVPVYALAVGMFGQIWVQSQSLLVQAIFLGTILHYSIEENGLFCALPYVATYVFSQISSLCSAIMTKKNFASVNHIRKFWNSIACLGSSACLLGLYWAGCNRPWSIFCIILYGGFNGFGYSGSVIVATDLSPTFAGSVSSISGAFGLLSPIFLPLVVGYLTNEKQTLEQWNKVFLVGIGVSMSCGVIFQVFGSAEIQPWNDVENSPEKDIDKTIQDLKKT